MKLLFAVVGRRSLEDYGVGRLPLGDYDRFESIEIQIEIELGLVLAKGGLELGLVVSI